MPYGVMTFHLENVALETPADPPGGYDHVANWGFRCTLCYFNRDFSVGEGIGLIKLIEIYVETVL